MYQMTKKDLPEQVIARMKKAYGVEQSLELAKKLGVSKQAVYNWYQSKKGVPVEYAQKCKEDCEISLDFLYYGEEMGVYEATNGRKVDTNMLSQRTMNLTNTQRLAVAKMLEGLEDLIEQFESENKKTDLIKEMASRLAELEREK